MKRIYLLWVALTTFSLVLNAQNLLQNGGMETWDDAQTPSSWTKAENVDQESIHVHSGTYSAKQTHDGTKDIMQTVEVIEGHTYQIQYFFLDNDVNAKTRIWSGFVDAEGWLGESDIFRPSSYSNDDSEWIEFLETGVAPAGATGFKFEVRTYGGDENGGVIYFDDFSIEDITSSDPIIEITSPENLSLVTSTELEVSFLVTNFNVAEVGEGDGHIHWDLDGTMTMKYDSDPIQLTDLAIGAHRLIIKLVDDSHADLSPAIADTLDFDVVDNSGENIVFNGDLELWSEAYPEGWAKAENVQQEMDIVHGGSYSAKQMVDGTKDLMQDVTVIPGHTYEVKFYYLDNSQGAKCRIYGGFKNNTDEWVGNDVFRPSSYSTDNEEWMEFSAIAEAPAESDTFRLEVRVYNEGDGGGEVYYDDFSIVDLTSVSVSSISKKTLKIYPNPAKDLLTIEGSRLISIEVIDINGKTMISSHPKNEKQSINISNLNQGIYFVKVKSFEGLKVSKLIKL